MRWKRVLVVICCALFIAPPVFAQDADDASMEQSKRQYRNGDYRGAIAALSEVVEMGARADALYLIGYSHFMLREFDEARAAFSQAFEADPSFDPRTIYQRVRPDPAD